MNEVEFKTMLEGVQQQTLAAIEQQKNDWTARYDELKAAGADSQEVKNLVERAIKRLDLVEAQMKAPLGSSTNPLLMKSVGEMVAECDATKEIAKQLMGTGWVRGRSATIPFKGFFGQELFNEQKTLIATSDIGNATPGILLAGRVPGIVKPPQRRVRVRELMPRFTTKDNSVEFVKENVFTNAASPQTEGSAKSESALTFTIDYANVKTLAHWIPATRQILDDFPALQAYINQRLLDGLMDEEDDQLVNGDGTGENLSGLITEATAYDTGLNETGDTQIDKIANAIIQLEAANHVADGVIINPREWRRMNKIKDQSSGVGNYVMGGPANMAAPTLWGLPVAVTTAVAAGKFFVGAFGRYTAIWDRMDARVDISTEHSDYFVKNLVAIRAEERLTFTVYRSDAIIYGSF